MRKFLEIRRDFLAPWIVCDVYRGLCPAKGRAVMFPVAGDKIGAGANE
jgi:hypothetical protein